MRFVENINILQDPCVVNRYNGYGKNKQRVGICNGKVCFRSQPPINSRIEFASMPRYATNSLPGKSNNLSALPSITQMPSDRLIA